MYDGVCIFYENVYQKLIFYKCYNIVYIILLQFT